MLPTNMLPTKLTAKMSRKRVDAQNSRGKYLEACIRLAKLLFY